MFDVHAKMKGLKIVKRGKCVLCGFFRSHKRDESKFR